MPRTRRSVNDRVPYGEVHVKLGGAGQKVVRAQHNPEGCEISAVASTGEVSSIIRPAKMGDNAAELTFYAVYGIIQVVGEEVWCVVRQLRRTENGHTAQGSSVRILQLTDRVRRAGLVHVCTDLCVVSRTARTITHSQSVLRGGVYTVLTRTEAYPSHLG